MSELQPELDSAPRALGSAREVDLLLDRARQQPGAIVSVALPAPRASVPALSALGATSFVWQPSEQEAWVGIDCTRVYRASGANRFSELRDRIQKDLEGSEGLRVFGGFAFAPGPQARAWSEFGDALFVLPRFSYQRSASGAQLSVSLTRDELSRRDGARLHVDELLRLGGRLAALVAPVGNGAGPSQTRDLSPGDWGRLVGEVLGLIASGRASKIVAARRAELEFERPLNVPATLQALRHEATGSTCFALRVGDTAFLGATPERLIKKHGSALESEAMAGTFRTTGSPLAEELLRSPKEHREHLPVLDAIVQALRPLSSSIHHPEQPEMRELPDLLHLCTPIHATLASPVHILDLVERLHPTPAVGGVPTDVALSFIATREGAERGWYAGPIGWLDEKGDGDFQVALRSGLVQGKRAVLYAGGGIVSGSLADGEYAETELKLRALRRSLRSD